MRTPRQIALVTLALLAAALAVLGWYLSALGTLAVLAVAAFLPKKKAPPPVCKLAGLEWTAPELCKNTLVTGSIGAGKTVAIFNILDQLFQTRPDFGGFFLDHKGDAHLGLLRLAKKYNREKDVVIIEVPGEAGPKYAPQRMNLLTAGGISSQTVAKIMADLSTRRGSDSKNAGFFKIQTQIQIAAAIDFFHYIGQRPTIARVHQFLSDTSYMVRLLKSLEPTIRIPSSSMIEDCMENGRVNWGKVAESVDESEPQHPLAKRWVRAFLNQAGEQRSGVVTSIQNALSPFIHPQLMDIFSSEKDDTVDFSEINNGKIICVLCPHTLPEEKSTLNHFFKTLFFFISAGRYELRAHGKGGDDNLLVMFLDEYQKAASQTDIDFMDILRDSRACFLSACQDEGSLIPVLGKDAAKVVIGKFRTRLIFSPESWDSAKAAADILGTRRIWKFSFGSSGGKGSRNRSLSDEHVIRPEYFARLKPYHCVIIQGALRRFKKNVKLRLV